MDKATQKRLFSAEVQRLKAKGMAPAATAQSSDIIAAIEALHSDVRTLELLMHDLKRGQTPEKAAVVDAADERAQSEVSLLKTEIRALSLAIEQTKSEIAALRPPNSDEDRLIAVTNELDAIVTATERATQDILEAAEKIDGLAELLQSAAKDNATAQMAGDLRDVVVRLFEACNFQDITGQRITKVVKTLEFIEQRVNRMIDIWGPETFEEAAPLPQAVSDEDARLLNGPALENQGVSQADIDKLFD